MLNNLVILKLQIFKINLPTLVKFTNHRGLTRLLLYIEYLYDVCGSLSSPGMILGQAASVARCEREGASPPLPERIAWSDSASTLNGLVCGDDVVPVVAMETGVELIVGSSRLLPTDLARGVYFPNGVRGNSLT